MSSPLVSPDWLAERLGDRQLILVDASWFLPAEGRSGRGEYVERHIPGAVFFDIDAIADHATELPHMLPTPQAFAEAAGALGLSRDAEVVVYDSYGLRSAARVWWTLRVFEFPKVFVLDGGLPLWLAEGRPVESGEVRRPSVELEPRFDPGLVADLDEVRRHLGAGDAALVDARPTARFRGEAPEPRPSLRSGHMPGAASLPFNELFDHGRLLPPADLRARFEAAGVDPDRPVIATCGSGVTAAVLALALAQIGASRTRVYDGSWAEWGGRSDTPVAAG